MQKYKVPFEDYNKVMASLDKPKTQKAIMTKYEFDQVIALRANQIALGAQAFVDTFDKKIQTNMELRAVALEELKQGRLPFIVRRKMPNNKFEYYRIKDMDLTAVQHMMR